MAGSSLTSLRGLRSFVAIADIGSFRKAAEALSISQPALSGQIRDLEKELGVVLLRRTTRNLQLTENGRGFLARIRRAILDLDTAVLDMRTQAAFESANLTVACVPSIAATVFPAVLRVFKSNYPEVSIQLCDERTESIEEKVRQSEVDFGIAPGPGGPGLSFDPIIDDQYFAVLPKEHELATAGSVTFSMLLKHPMIAMRPEQSMRRSLDLAARDLGMTLNPVFEVYHHDTLMGMVAEGLGVGAMPYLTISLLRLQNVATAPITGPPVARTIGILTRRGEQLTGAARALAEVTRHHLLALANNAAHNNQGNPNDPQVAKGSSS